MLEKYGGAEHLDAPDRSLLMAEVSHSNIKDIFKHIFI